MSELREVEMTRERRRERCRENRAYYTSRGICGKCGKRPVEPGRLKCFECLQKDVEAHKRMMSRKTEEERKNIAEKKKESKRRLTAFRQKNGLCTQCGRPTVQGKRLCIDHLVKKRREKDKRYNNDIPREMRPSLGLCWRCGKAPIVEGKSLCADCLSSISEWAKNQSKNPSPAQQLAREEFIKRQRGLNNLIFGGKNGSKKV